MPNCFCQILFLRYLIVNVFNIIIILFNKINFQVIFYAIVIFGITVLRVLYGSLPTFLCNIVGFLRKCALLFIGITMTMHTFTRFMFVCIWKRMRQMDDNLIVRIVTIQTIVMSVLLTAGHWLQFHGQHFGNQVSSLFLLHRALF